MREKAEFNSFCNISSERIKAPKRKQEQGDDKNGFLSFIDSGLPNIFFGYFFTPIEKTAERVKIKTMARASLTGAGSNLAAGVAGGALVDRIFGLWGRF